jgi:hypothetical protein
MGLRLGEYICGKSLCGEVCILLLSRLLKPEEPLICVKIVGCANVGNLIVTFIAIWIIYFGYRFIYKKK